MKRQWTPDELAEQWTLTPNELTLLANKTGATRLGFALLLRFFQHEGRFPTHKQDVPGSVIVHVAKQVGAPPECYAQYDWSGRTIEYHRAQIRTFLGFREATRQDSDALVEWLCTDILPHDQHIEHVRAALAERCRDAQIEPPSAGQIERVIRSALHAFEERLYAAVMARLSPATVTMMEALLRPSGTGVPIGTGAVEAPAPPDAAAQPRPSAEPVEAEETGEAGRSVLAELKMDPGRISLDTVLAEIEKLRQIRALGLPADRFGQVSPKVLQRYRQRAAAEAPSHLRAHSAPVRTLLVAALCRVRGEEITDSLADLLVQLVHKIGARAERRVEKELLADLRRVTGKTGVLFRLAEAAVEHPDGVVREVLFPVVGEQTLRDLVKEYKSTGPAYRLHVHTHLRASYGSHYRRMLPALLDTLEFRSNNAVHRPVIEALELVKKYAGSTHSRQRTYAPLEAVPIDGVVPATWRELVVTRDKQGHERVDRIGYELCVLQVLREHLRCKELWVVGANRYRNPEDDLPADFDAQRAAYCAALHLPLDADTFMTKLQQAMASGLETLDRGLPKNRGVKILSKGNGWISVSPLEAQAEPVNLGHLKAELVARWPMTSLLDILKETDLRVGFTELLSSVGQREILERGTLQKRLLLCLYGLGTNTGLKRVAAGEHDESYADLRYVRRRFLHKEQLRAAIAQVANAIFRARQPEIWGEGTTACASDSKKFGAWDQNLMTEWHIRYGGRGVMIYWHVERNATCISSQLKQCSSSEVAAMMEGVLRHCTEMTVAKNYVDSHGQSEVAFAFSHLLGFQLLPRLKAIHAQKLYRPATGEPEAYPRLQAVLTRPSNWALIRQQYDQLVKYATALRLGTADSEVILRRFTRNAPQHPTYQALAELGKAVKTIFLCQYLHSEALRREIHEGLNIIENWNSANGFIFYGKGGEIATNRLDEQELAVLSLHLLQICLVYINTLMLQRVLKEPAWQERLTRDDLRALTPLTYTHVNPYGIFRLDMQERLRIDQEALAG